MIELKKSQIASVFRGRFVKGTHKISFLRRVRIVRIFVKAVCLSACSNALSLDGFPRT